MKLGVLFSGGKDSCSATHIAQQYGHEVACLLSIQSKNKDSYMFHTPNISLVQLQAEAMDLPILIQETEGEKEDELVDLKELIEKGVKEFGIQGIVTGAVASVYQATRIQKICHELNIWCFNPLWQRDPYEHIKELVTQGFEIYIGAIAAYPMSKEWLGKKIGKKELEELKELQDKHKINPSGEGGEFETFVAHGPGWKKRIIVKQTETKYDNHAGVWYIKETELEDEEKDLIEREQDEFRGNTLLINTCEEPLSLLEFVEPIANILNNNCSIIHYKNEEQITQELQNYSHIIICGTALKDDEFLKNLDMFYWVQETNKPVLGICAGYHVLGLLEDKELQEDLEIGMQEVNKDCSLGLVTEAYFLHHNGLKEVGPIFEANNKVGIVFHPEVRNEKIVSTFLSLT